MYPQDRARERKDEGEQPFKDAREALREQEAELARKAPLPEQEEEEPTREDQEAAAEERLDKIGREVAEESESS